MITVAVLTALKTQKKAKKLHKCIHIKMSMFRLPFTASCLVLVKTFQQ